MADYDAAKANSEAQKRGALAALAQGGSEGLSAYNNAISQANAGRQQALNAATQRSALIGGPESNVANYSAPINAAGNEAVGELSTNKSALGTYFNQLSSANGDYFNKVSAALPVEELAQLRAMANKSTGKQNKTTIQNAAISEGTTAANQATAQKSAINKAVTTQQQGAQAIAAIGGLSGQKALAKSKKKVATNKPFQQTISSAKAASKSIVNDPFALARQAAINRGMDPDEAATLFSRQNNSGQGALAGKIVKNTSQYKQQEKFLLNQLNSGVSRSKIDAALNDYAKSNPATAAQLRKDYLNRFPTDSSLNSKNAKAAGISVKKWNTLSPDEQTKALAKKSKK